MDDNIVNLLTKRLAQQEHDRHTKTLRIRYMIGLSASGRLLDPNIPHRLGSQALHEKDGRGRRRSYLEDPAGQEPSISPVKPQESPSTTSAAQGSFAAAPSPPAPMADPQQSPAHSTEAPPFYIMQLRNQIQRIEARQIELITESKVFQTTLLQFLYDNFPAAEFPPAPNAPPAPPVAANSFATPSTGASETEEVQYSSNAEPDTFDWNTPHDFPPSAPAPPTNVAESSIARKRKTPAARIIKEDHSPKLTPDPPATAEPPA
ncbi:hypothetical protein V6N11_047309 [Hibiscus sabdariffa]|uniref:Uncharacterized protein n=1 Tax=Hibiscus sabdariffa TaxID=183260 RepID=A0ABR2PC29_9ROSI